jgi:hypothetical protein
MAFEIGAPHRTVPHLLADLVELLLISGYEGYATISPATIESIVANSSIPSDEIEELESEASDPALSDAEKVDVQAVYLEDVWKQLQYRRNRFDDSYPFMVSGDKVSFHENLTPSMRVYRFLLSCSRLRSFPAKMRVAWAKKFAMMCAHALKQMIPPEFIVRIFDANSDDRRDHYGTDLRRALRKLGEDLHVEVNELICDQQSSSGDAGIDIVGVYPFKDAGISTFAVLGQCAAQEKEWPKKRFEGSPPAIRNFFVALSDPMHVTFIPLCFRESSGIWVNSAHSSGTLLLDRVRLMNLLTKDPQIDELVAQNWFLEFENELEEACH